MVVKTIVVRKSVASACRFESDHGYHFKSMKVKAKALLEVELSHEEQLKVTVQTLRRALVWPTRAYIDINGNLIVDHDVNTSHKFINETEIIRKADEEDFALSKILHRLSVSQF